MICKMIVAALHTTLSSRSTHASPTSLPANEQESRRFLHLLAIIDSGHCASPSLIINYLMRILIT